MKATAPSHAVGPAPALCARRVCSTARRIFLTQLAATSLQSGANQVPTHRYPLLETDAKSGRSHFRLPLPEPQTLATITQMLAALLPPSKGK